MEQQQPQEFFGRTYGFGWKRWPTIGYVAVGIGFLMAIASASTRPLGIRLIVVGMMIVAMTHAQKHPLVVVSAEALAIRKGILTQYRTVRVADIARVDIGDVQVVIVPTAGRPIRMGARAFSSATWAAMRKSLEAFAKSCG